MHLEEQGKVATRNQLEQQALKYIQRGQHSKAVRIFQHIVRQDPRDRRIRHKLADLYLRLGRNADAERHLREVAEQSITQGQPRAAIAVYKQLLELSPRDPQVTALLGDAYKRTGLTVDAERYLREAINIFLRKNMFKEAIHSAQHLLELRPTDTVLRFKLAELHARAGDEIRAIETFKDLAVTFRRRGESGEVARVLELAAKLVPDDFALRLEAARARLSSGEPQLALALVKPVYESQQNEPAVQELMARALLASGDADQALPLLRTIADFYREHGKAEDLLRVLQMIRKAGVDDQGLMKELGAVGLEVQRRRMRLNEAPVLSASNDQELAICTRAAVQERYGFAARAGKSLGDGLEKHPDSLAIKACLIENLLLQDRREEGLELLKATLTEASGQARQVILDRLKVLEGEPGDYGAAEEPPSPAEALLDDDLLDDELLEDDLLEDSPAKSLRLDENPPSPPLPVESASQLMEPNGTKAPSIHDGQASQESDMAVDSGFPVEPADLQVTGSEISQGRDDDAIWDALLASSLSPESEQSMDPTPSTRSDPVNSNLDSGHGFDSLHQDSSLLDAEALAALGRYDEALALLTRKGGLLASLVEARCWAGLGKGSRARSILRAALADADEEHPRYPDALFELSRIYFQEGKEKGALRLLDEIRDLDASWHENEVAAWIRGIQMILGQKPTRH